MHDRGMACMLERNGMSIFTCMGGCWKISMIRTGSEEGKERRKYTRQFYRLESTDLSMWFSRYLGR